MSKKYKFSETTTAGSVAAVAMPLGGVKKRKKTHNPDSTIKNALDSKQHLVNSKDKYRKQEKKMKKKTSEDIGKAVSHGVKAAGEVGDSAVKGVAKTAGYALGLPKGLQKAYRDGKKKASGDDDEEINMKKKTSEDISKAARRGAQRFHAMETVVNEAYIENSKDAINTLGALRKIGKHIETGDNTYDGNLANMYTNDVYDVIMWIENNLDTNDPKYKQILAPVIELRKKAKGMERELGSGKNARFGNEIANTLYPLMQWIQKNAANMNEGLANMAHKVEKDHEVQMARADLYKVAKYAIKLHEMLRQISEEEGLEGWQQAKITKASDYISSVYHNLDYSMKFDGAGELGEGYMRGYKKYHCKDCGCQMHNCRPDCTCRHDSHDETGYWWFDKDGNNVRGVAEGKGKYKSDAQRKAVHAAKADSGYKKKMRENLESRLVSTIAEKNDLEEKAVSRAQQKAAGAALAAKRGDIPKSKLKGASKRMVKMSTAELEKYAGTKHKGLPKKVATEQEKVYENLNDAISEAKKSGGKKKPVPTKPSKWSYAKSQAKEKFDVYPSAYANAWAAKKYKELGGGWRMGQK